MSQFDKALSYTISDILPFKLFKDIETLKQISEGSIPIKHIQFNPTNRCNLNCTFCSCANRDRGLEMKVGDIERFIKQLPESVVAVTITGGGEPLVHPDINRIIDMFWDRGISIGLVTNGLLLDKLTSGDKLTWCRISHSDSRGLGIYYRDTIKRAVKRFPYIDWAFSYVVSSNPNLDMVAELVRFTNFHNFTHVRFVGDLFDVDNIPMDGVKQHLKDLNVDDSKCIYQPRNHPEVGGDCYIGYLRPIIDVDFKVYTCCGAQYAIKGREKGFPLELCMGDGFDLESISKRSCVPVDGTICSKCYYMNYNRLLGNLLSDIQHVEFV